MSNALILLTPLLVLLILAVFGFTGCTPFSAAESPPEPAPPPPPPVVTPPVPVPPVPVPTPAATYKAVVASTAGFAALWPLDETGGNVANVTGPLNPAANGVYTSAGGAPAGTGYTLGGNGVLFHKDTTDFAPEFDGSAGYVEVQFNGPLNPAKSVPGFSVELWAKPNPTAGGTTQVLISSHRFNSTGDQQGYEIALVRNPPQLNQQIRVRVFANGAMGQAMVQPLQGDASEWRHIVFTYQILPAVGQTVTLLVRLAKSTNPFKDGPHSATYESVISTTPATLRFGAGHSAGQPAENFFAGRIDNVAFYNAVLTQGDIDKHFNLF